MSTLGIGPSAPVIYQSLHHLVLYLLEYADKAVTRVRCRYPVAGAYGIPAWFIVGLSNWLPDHLADAMFLVIEPSEVTPSVVKQEL